MGMFSGLGGLVGPALGGAAGFLAGGPVGGLIGAGIGGTMSTNETQRDIAQEANAFSAQQTAEQMAFQERMRKTQYQTAVEDLKKADLNPMLAYTQGGAGTPSGAAAIGQQANIKNPYDALTSSAAQVAQVEMDLTKKTAEINNIQKQTQYTDALTASEVLRMPNISQEFKRLYAQTLLLESQKEQTSALTSKTLYEMPEAIQKGKYYNKYEMLPFELRDFSQAASNAASAFGSLNPFKKR